MLVGEKVGANVGAKEKLGEIVGFALIVGLAVVGCMVGLALLLKFGKGFAEGATEELEAAVGFALNNGTYAGSKEGSAVDIGVIGAFAAVGLSVRLALI